MGNIRFEFELVHINRKKKILELQTKLFIDKYCVKERSLFIWLWIAIDLSRGLPTDICGNEQYFFSLYNWTA